VTGTGVLPQEGAGAVAVSPLFVLVGWRGSIEGKTQAINVKATATTITHTRLGLESNHCNIPTSFSTALDTLFVV
jgi:hypothetical protein